MTTPIHDRIHGLLNERRIRGLLRTTAVPDPAARIDLSTNSYLALHENEEVRREAVALTGGLFSGNLASRIIASTSPLYDLLEKEIAEWKRTESALLFNSGYAANVGILQALCTRDTEVYSDRLNHASIIDGIRFSGARLVRYRHGDVKDLRDRLARSGAAEKIIVTDTVFSMDGDCAPLADICELGRRYVCLVMVDEAHATGVFGKRLSGLAEALGVEDGIDLRMGTLSKAVAGLGGFVACTASMRDYLVNHARSMIYSTGLPHSVLAYDLAAVRFIRKSPDLGPRLLEAADEFRRGLSAEGFDTLDSTTQIVPSRVRDERSALALSQYLKESGIKAPAIRPPTVPAGTARVRFSINRSLGKMQIAEVIGAMREWKRRGT